MTDEAGVAFQTPDAPKPTTTIGATLSPLLRASRFGLVILGTLYTVGLLVVNIDLARYGLLSVELARAEYVMAGALWTFLMVVTLAALDQAIETVKGFLKTQKRGPEVFLFFMRILGTIIVFQYVIWILSKNEIALFTIFEPHVAWAFLWIILSGYAVSLAIGNTSNLLRRDPITLRALFEGQGRMGTPIYSVVFLLSMLGIYAIGVHPHFPRELGGGKRTPVYLVTSDSTPTHLMDLPLPIAGSRIGPVLLLFETATMYMVKPVEESPST